MCRKNKFTKMEERDKSGFNACLVICMHETARNVNIPCIFNIHTFICLIFLNIVLSFSSVGMWTQEDWVLCRVFNKGRDSSLQDNNNDNHETQRFETNDAPDLNSAPNYNNQLPPLLSPPPSTTIDPEKMKIQVCDQWEQLMKQPSRTTDHPYHHHCHHQTVACGWEQMMIGSMSSSSSHGPDHESLLNLLYVDNNNSVNITEDQNYEQILLSSDMTSLEHKKTCMGSSSDGGMVSNLHMECGGLSFETDNLLPFH